MKRTLIAILSVALLISAFAAAPALAKDKVFYMAIPMDYSKVYTYTSRVFEKGYRDYVTLVNMDGGVGGYRFEFLSADQACEPQRTIELYEQYKKMGALMINTCSTPPAMAILPRCMKDGIVLYTPVHGRGDSLLGEVFPWVFPIGANYWSQSAVLLEYIYGQEKQDLKGKKIAYVHIDTSFGREVIPVLTRLSEKLGYNMRTFGYPPPGNEQSSIWTQVRRFQPDWVIIWGAGIGQPTAVKEALRNGIPINRIASCNWLVQPDMKIIGPERAKGVVRVEPFAEGRDAPIIQKILKEVYAKGKGAGDEKLVGGSLYNFSAATATIYGEVVRIAVKKYGDPLTADKIRAALEQIKDFNCGGLTAPINTSPTDHEGGGGARVCKWDGKHFVPIADWHASRFRDTVLEVARESAAKYKAEGHPFKNPSIVVK